MAIFSVLPSHADNKGLAVLNISKLAPSYRHVYHQHKGANFDISMNLGTYSYLKQNLVK